VKDRSADSNGWASFESVLDEFERPADEAEELALAESALSAAFAAFAPPIDFEPQARAAADRWDLALDWIADPPELAARPAAAPSVDPDVIAAELGLAWAMSRDDLKRARRRFMWENHPDRRPDAPPELANRRVAIANMLIDRADQALRARRP
jgi:hypothetical protein